MDAPVIADTPASPLDRLAPLVAEVTDHPHLPACARQAIEVLAELVAQQHASIEQLRSVGGLAPFPSL